MEIKSVKERPINALGYQNLLDALEDQADIKAIQEFHEEDQQTIPYKTLQTIAGGESTVVAFRKLRGLTQAKLAKEAGVSRQYLCQIEKKERHGSSKILKKIANILKVDLELLIE